MNDSLQKEKLTISGPGEASLLSVVIPVHNGGKFLSRSVGSALSQTYEPLQVIAVDDGSADDSPEILRNFGPRVQLVQQANAGVARARNTGILRAAGEYIAFLDQDDWWLPEKAARQIECFRKDEEVGLVHTAVQHFDDTRGQYTGPLNPLAQPEKLMGNCFGQLLLNNAIYNSSVMIRRRVLETVGLLDVGIPGNTIQDYDLWLRIARCFKLDFVSEPLTVFRLHTQQGTWNRVAILTEEMRLLDRILNRGEVQATDELLSRVSTLLAELGKEHLRAHQRQAARNCFIRLLKTRPSSHALGLFASSFVPSSLLDYAREKRQRWRKVS